MGHDESCARTLEDRRNARLEAFTAPPKPEDYSAGFGRRLRSALEKAGVSQVDLASKSGISAMHINHLMSGRRSPSTENLAKLLNAMWWVDARELICGPIRNSDSGTDD